MEQQNVHHNKFRKWMRSLHRDLSFFFAGVLLLYATSGFMLNHKRDFNSNYSVESWSVQLQGDFPSNAEQWDQTMIQSHLQQIGQGNTYMKSYSPKEGQIKVFIRRGCTLLIDTQTGEAVYESLHKRPLLSSLNRLHYNPSRWWTIFSDVFLFSLILIIISGLVIIKGHKGFWGRGGIEFAAGILIPLLFIFFT